MADNLTQPTTASVADFLDAVAAPRRRAEGHQLAALMTTVTGVEPVMWGPSIVGYGTYHYRYASGREGDMCRVGFSPRASALSLYGLQEAPEADALLQRLGPHRTGASCVYVTRLDAVDADTLRDLIARGWELERS